MSTQRVNALRDRMTGLIAAWLPPATACRSHPGGTDAAVAAALLATEPEGTDGLILVVATALGAGRMIDDGRQLHRAALSAWIATRHADAGARDRAALDLVEAIAGGLPLAAPLTDPSVIDVPAQPAPGAPRDVAAALLTPPAAVPEVCVWQVTWSQDLTLGNSLGDAAADPLPDEVLVGFTPRIGPPHVDDYVTIIGGTGMAGTVP